MGGNDSSADVLLDQNLISYNTLKPIDQNSERLGWELSNS